MKRGTKYCFLLIFTQPFMYLFMNKLSYKSVVFNRGYVCTDQVFHNIKFKTENLFHYYGDCFIILDKTVKSLNGLGSAATKG